MLDPYNKFIELNRTFVELSNQSDINDDVDFRRSLHLGKRFNWDDLTKEHRVILLSEAGTGKTEEIRHIAEALRNEGKAAFFLRLEYISQDFEIAFEVGTHKEFEAWLSSSDIGWLFLDSIDESRLKSPGDFEFAIRKISNRISNALQRVHVFITGRTTAWRPVTDLELCTRHLPFQSPRMKSDNNDEQLKQVHETGFIKTSVKEDANELSSYKIVALLDLDPEQIRIFITARGISDSKRFLLAVEKTNAWPFTARPQDLDELVGFWNDEGKLGSRLEILQHSIDRRLLERRQGDANAHPISKERLNAGASIVAATATLCKVQNINVPDGCHKTNAISIAEVLQDWDVAEHSALLARPIFDEAIYGTVRFHHRSARELLTARWLKTLLQHETSRRRIEALFFRKQYGIDIVIPVLRPILTWLTIFDEKLCDRIRKIAPDVIWDCEAPSQLPIAIRRSILHEMCEQIGKVGSRSDRMGYEAVQRFATEDLVDDVRKLIAKYDRNDDVLFFLMRMVWLGELKVLLPEATHNSLRLNASKYTRLAAIRAVRAIGLPDDIQHVRAKILAIKGELERDWIVELLTDLETSMSSVKWLLDSLVKTKEKERFRADELSDAVIEFVGKAETEVLPFVISGFNGLLDVPPVLEHRYCEISERYGWLLPAAALAVNRLIESYHPASLETHCLEILHKTLIARRAEMENIQKSREQFSSLVPSWPELNRACFWYEVAKSRKNEDNRREGTPTEIWQVSFFGSFWRFESSDFEYALAQINARSLQSDKLLALSLAFSLYVTGGRQPKQRHLLKQHVASDAILATRLRTYLKPPAKGRDQAKQWELKRRRQQEARERKESDNRRRWIASLKENLHKLEQSGLKAGEVSNHQWWLHEETRRKDGHSNRWTEGNWRCLIPEFGENIARAYRDGTLAFWREHRPKLRSEGAPPNETTTAVIFGLTGLQIEANETSNWPKTLDLVEVELACRYASFELNGFPPWFPALFEEYSPFVTEFLLQEIRFELSTEKVDIDSHYLLSDLSWSGQWSWDYLAPDIFNILASKEPLNLSNLEFLLNILQGSSIPNVRIAMLASTKCRKLKKPLHLAFWFAVWFGVDPNAALPQLIEWIGKIRGSRARTDFMMRLVTHLVGDRRSGHPRTIRSAFRVPEHLKNLYLLMHQHIRMEEDINRTGKGGYSPGLRDDAQDARENLAEILRRIPGKEAFVALMEIARTHPAVSSRMWFEQRAKSKAEEDAEMDAWTPSQVREFHDSLERTPSTHRELAELVSLRLLDLKDDFENGDSSYAPILQQVKLETEVRNFIGGMLRDRSRNRYIIPQEEEFADAKRVDLRFHGVGFDNPVPCELKLADNWSGPQLLERLENQLCGDYLRDNRSTHGFFVLVFQGRRTCSWQVSKKTKSVDFQGLVSALEAHWYSIQNKYPGIEQIEVVGIDLTLRRL